MRTTSLLKVGVDCARLPVFVDPDFAGELFFDDASAHCQRFEMMSVAVTARAKRTKNERFAIPVMNSPFGDLT
jgi:hypothetical protein